jgi:hypothetical protein
MKRSTTILMIVTLGTLLLFLLNAFTRSTAVLMVGIILLLLLLFGYGCICFALWFLFGIPRKEEPVQPLMTQMSSVTYSDPTYNQDPAATSAILEPVRVVESDQVPGPTYITVNNPEPQRPAAPLISQDVQQQPMRSRAYEPTGYVETANIPQRPPYDAVPVYGNPDGSIPRPGEPAREMPDTPYYQPPVQQQPEYVQPVQPAPQQVVYYQPTYNEPHQAVYYQPTTQNDYYQAPGQPRPEPPDYGIYEPPTIQPLAQPMPIPYFSDEEIPPYELPPREGQHTPVVPGYYYEPPAIHQLPQPQCSGFDTSYQPATYEPMSYGNDQLTLPAPMTPILDESFFLPVLGGESRQQIDASVPSYTSLDVPVADYPTMQAPFFDAGRAEQE